MGMHEEQTPKTNPIRENYIAMTPIEGEPTPEQKEWADRFVKARPIGHGEHFTVVYFMPDGDAIIRYSKTTELNSFMAAQAFAIIKVVRSINGSEPGIEFLKCRFDIGEVMQNMANSYLGTNDEDKQTPPKTFPIND